MRVMDEQLGKLARGGWGGRGVPSAHIRGGLSVNMDREGK